MSRCQRCDSEDAHPIRLFGDFRANLCVDCVNLYTITLTQSSLWARQQAVEAEQLYLEHAARSRTLEPFERYCELATKRLQIQKDAIDLAAAFVAPITPAIADEAAEWPVPHTVEAAEFGEGKAGAPA